MYFQLSAALKNRFIMELRRFWATHPKYRDLVDRIQGKYSFRERPQFGIIVKTSGATRVDLAADNYVGVVQSYTYLTRVQGSPGLAIEWVREDSLAIQRNAGMFPSPPGVYYIEIVEGPRDPNGFENLQFFVDPLLDVNHEQVMQIDETTAQLAHAPLDGTLRLYESPSGYMLQEGIEYVVDSTGLITLTRPVNRGRSLVADYRYPIETRGPFPYRENTANNTAIPGVVLAFGRRGEKGDKLAVVVHPIRMPAALEYGGRWDVSLEFEVIARDVYAQQEITDLSVMFLLGVLRSVLTKEGIEMTEISMGGESEEVYDETGDDYFYNATFSATVQTDWSIHVPLDLMIRSVTPLTSEEAKIQANLPEDEQESMSQAGNIRILEGLGLEGLTDPFFSNRTATFELIR